MSNTTNITPTMPLGPYPHPRLCGQVGTTPRRTRTRTINRIVPRLIAGTPEICANTDTNSNTRFDPYAGAHRGADRQLLLAMHRSAEPQ